MQAVTVGYERYGAHSDLAYFHERMRQENMAISIEELAWPKSGNNTKIDRVQRLGPDFQAHRFHVPYPTRSDRLTSNQRRRTEEGYGHLVSRRIIRRDENGKLYDLGKRFLAQVAGFPYINKVDIIDAVARIFDLDMRAPVYHERGDLEPEHV